MRNTPGYDHYHDLYCPCYMPEPTPTDLVRQLREALGWPDVAMPISPKEAWNQALRQVRTLREQCDLWVPLRADGGAWSTGQSDGRVAPDSRQTEDGRNAAGSRGPTA